MIRWILERGIRSFGRKYQYDVSYMLDVLDVSTSAGAKLAFFPKYMGPKQARDVVAGAYLASTLDGDCGPCAQLVVDMWASAGTSTDALRACVEGRSDEAGDTGLGYRFAQAAITGLPEADNLAIEIADKYGKQAQVAASFAAATGRFYPVFKRGMGHGQTCQRLVFDGQEELVIRAHG